MTPNPALEPEPEPEPEPDQSRTCSWAAVERVSRSGNPDPDKRAPWPLGGSVGRVVPTRSKEPPGRRVGRSVRSFRPGRKSPLAVRWVGRSGRSDPFFLFFCRAARGGRSVGSTRVENTENPKPGTVGRRRLSHFQLRIPLFSNLRKCRDRACRDTYMELTLTRTEEEGNKWEVAVGGARPLRCEL